MPQSGRPRGIQFEDQSLNSSQAQGELQGSKQKVRQGTPREMCSSFIMFLSYIDSQQFGSVAVQARLHSIERLTFFMFLGGPYNGTYHRELRSWVTTMGRQRASYSCGHLVCTYVGSGLRVPELSVYMDIACQQGTGGGSSRQCSC